MTESFTSELSARVYHDKHGYYVQVGEDRDALELCELIYSNGSNNSAEQSMVIGPWAMAVEVANAIIVLDKMRKKMTDD